MTPAPLRLVAEPLLDVPGLAELLGVRERWVYEHLAELPHYRVGRYVRFGRAEIEAWLAGQHRPGAGEAS